MIERFLFAGAITIAALFLGLLVRAYVRHRTVARSASAIVPISNGALPRLLVFSSRWCSDCLTQRSVIEESRDSWTRPIDVTYHDAVNERELAGRFGILMVPALVVASSDGRVLDVRQGLVDEDRLRSLIDAAA